MTACVCVSVLQIERISYIPEAPASPRLASASLLDTAAVKLHPESGPRHHPSLLPCSLWKGINTAWSKRLTDLLLSVRKHFTNADCFSLKWL